MTEPAGVPVLAPTIPAIPVPVAATPDPVKPGLWTTEHVLAYVAILLTALFGAGVIPSTGPVAQGFTVVAIALTTLGYNVSRGMVKSSAIHALARTRLAASLTSAVAAASPTARVASAGVATGRMMIGLVAAGLLVGSFVQLAAYTGCAATKASARTMSGSFASCVKADLGQIVGHGSNATTLLGDVAQLIAGSPDSLEADLTRLALIAGVDSVKCAIVAVAAVLEPAPSLTAAMLARSRGLDRAKAWSAATGGAL